MIVKLAEGDLRTRYGHYKEALYYDGQKESVAMVLGDVKGAEDVLCRVHSACLFGHYFHSVECTCREEMEASQKMIEKAGRGIIILLDQEGKGNGHYALLKSVAFKRQGMKQADAYEAAGFRRDARDYQGAARILTDLEVKSISLITNNPSKAELLTQHGIHVSSMTSLML